MFLCSDPQRPQRESLTHFHVALLHWSAGILENASTHTSAIPLGLGRRCDSSTLPSARTVTQPASKRSSVAMRGRITLVLLLS